VFLVSKELISLWAYKVSDLPQACCSLCSTWLALKNDTYEHGSGTILVCTTVGLSYLTPGTLNSCQKLPCFVRFTAFGREITLTMVICIRPLASNAHNTTGSI